MANGENCKEKASQANCCHLIRTYRDSKSSVFARLICALLLNYSVVCVAPIVSAEHIHILAWRTLYDLFIQQFIFERERKGNSASQMQ